MFKEKKIEEKEKKQEVVKGYTVFPGGKYRIHEFQLNVENANVPERGGHKLILFKASTKLNDFKDNTSTEIFTLIEPCYANSSFWQQDDSSKALALYLWEKDIQRANSWKFGGRSTRFHELIRNFKDKLFTVIPVAWCLEKDYCSKEGQLYYDWKVMTWETLELAQDLVPNGKLHNEGFELLGENTDQNIEGAIRPGLE